MVISENLTILTYRQPTIKLNKPIYAGTTILDTSKVCMYRHLTALQDVYGPEKTRLAMTDTDSFLLDIEHPDMHSKFPELQIDTSTFPVDHKYFTMENAQLGMLKCEMGGKRIIARYNPATMVYATFGEDR